MPFRQTTKSTRSFMLDGGQKQLKSCWLNFLKLDQRKKNEIEVSDVQQDTLGYQ